MMTKADLVTRFHEANDQWHQRWSTRCDLMGRAFIRLQVGDKYTRYWQLDGLLPIAKTYRGSRVDWYAIREDDDDSMTLYRFSNGTEASIETDPRIVAVFRHEFAMDGGFRLRVCECSYSRGDA